MSDSSKNRTPMPEQDPTLRIKNFLEVTLGYTEEMAMNEANRCLNCKHRPCVQGCPVNVKIPDFIKLVSEGKFEEAYQVVKSTNSLPAVCGRVCPQESQCENFCVHRKKGESVAIGRLERFVADWHLLNSTVVTPPNVPKKGIKIAIIGSGPAGLACAGDLLQLGYDVTVFEAFHTPGGVLMYGIPEFRLPKKLVKQEIKTLEKMGVEILTNMVIGKSYSLDELFEEGYQSIFIGTGAGLPNFMDVPGENLNGVYTANEFLTRINLMKAYDFPNCDTPIHVDKNVAVVGGGNVAMDAARSAKRLGVENVYLVYRRSESEMPARQEEIHHAKEEGIIFKTLTSPVKIHGTDEGWVTHLECVEMELGEADSSGRRKPVEKQGSNFNFEVDTIIIAIGQSPNPLITSTTPGLSTHKWGGIETDESTGQTSREGVFAGGDVSTGAATVILAMGAGKRAAKAIDKYITEINGGSNANT